MSLDYNQRLKEEKKKTKVERKIISKEEKRKKNLKLKQGKNLTKC